VKKCELLVIIQQTQVKPVLRFIDKIEYMMINYPLKEGKIIQPFGRDASDDPIYKEFYKIFDYKHCGIDFDTEIGTNVYAAFSGIVVRAENHEGMGNVIGIRNGNLVGLYAHLSEIGVILGQLVSTGDLIGKSGATGKACPKPHLHFELRDLTKSSLKEMVFEPIFEKEIDRYKDTFTYTVNNKNTQKTLRSLSKLYFGTQNYWELIKIANGFDFDESIVLEEASEIIIPNYN